MKDYRHVFHLVADAFLPNPDNLPEVDHRDRDRFNDRLLNLRRCTKSQNCANRGSKRGSSSIYRGASYSKARRCWIASITSPAKRDVFLGAFRSEIAAALAYDQAAREHWGEFAFQNRDHFPLVPIGETETSIIEAGRITEKFHRKGEASPNAKVTTEMVVAMRREYRDGSITFVALGKKYNLSQDAVADIIKMKTWKHVALS